MKSGPLQAALFVLALGVLVVVGATVSFQGDVNVEAATLPTGAVASTVAPAPTTSPSVAPPYHHQQHDDSDSAAAGRLDPRLPLRCRRRDLHRRRRRPPSTRNGEPHHQPQRRGHAHRRSGWVSDRAPDHPGSAIRPGGGIPRPTRPGRRPNDGLHHGQGPQAGRLHPR